MLQCLRNVCVTWKIKGHENKAKQIDNMSFLWRKIVKSSHEWEENLQNQPNIIILKIQQINVRDELLFPLFHLRLFVIFLWILFPKFPVPYIPLPSPISSSLSSVLALPCVHLLFLSLPFGSLTSFSFLSHKHLTASILLVFPAYCPYSFFSSSSSSLHLFTWCLIGDRGYLGDLDHSRFTCLRPFAGYLSIAAHNNEEQ